MPACVAMALALSAGGTLYMVLSVALMLIQRDERQMRIVHIA